MNNEFDTKHLWQENTGVQPVGDDVLVDVSLGNGHMIYEVMARHLDWPFDEKNSELDIIKWRLHKG